MKKKYEKNKGVETVDRSVLKNTNQAKGITLIALVITIIVLIILAGVAINTLTGDNGIITRAIQAKESTKEKEAKEEVNVAVSAVQIEKNITKMTQEEQRAFLENELKNIENTSSVKIYGKGFIATHKGYDFEVSDKLAIVNVKEIFNAEEWDKTAAPEDVFIWKSDDSSNEGYGVVIGYTANVESYTTLRFPSRCTKISFDIPTNYEETNTATSRAFTNNILKVEIPATVKTIGEWAFGGPGSSSFKSLEEVVIGDGVTTIKSAAFNSCIELTNVIIPNSVISIESNVFQGCTGLTNITIPDSVTSIESNMFQGCTGLKNIMIPDSVISIGYNAFSRCSSLTSVKITDCVTSIGNNAFSGCSSLASVTIPNSVTNIGYHAFYQVPHIYYNGTATGSPWGAEAIN